MKTPTCPGCGAKFSWDTALLRCRVCKITSEIVAAGSKAVERYRKQTGAPQRRGGSFYRRRNKHGRRGCASKRGGTPRIAYRGQN